ncbi:30S ribosomal protein S3ae [Candidatus Bathyarchaeota archaeon]|nr:30S ribosomal protein S3ae [Candidatus Bathyarchaeota archaeon]
MSPRKRIRDKWRGKSWYTVLAPPYFGNVELGTLPADDPDKLVGRVIDSTLYEVTNDFAHQYLKIFFRITDVDGKTAHTVFKGHEYSRDYLRSLVRRRTTRVDGLFNVTTKDGYKMRVAVCAFTLSRIKTSQEQAIRVIMKRIVKEKASVLTFDQFAQEIVLGKIASDIYNAAKRMAPLRHVGVRKSRLTTQPQQAVAG